MQLITHTSPRLLIADEGKHFRDKNDEYVPEHYDEQGNLIPEHQIYWMTICFPGSQIKTLEQAQELYIEEEI